MSDWIEVADRLPQEGECVLIGNSIHRHVGEARFRRINGREVFVGTHDESLIAHPAPTHWLPLPVPPTSE